MSQVDSCILATDKTLGTRRYLAQRVGTVVSKFADCEVRELAIVGTGTLGDKKVLARVLLAGQLCEDMAECSGECNRECESILLRQQLERITFGRFGDRDLRLSFLGMKLKKTPSRRWKHLASAHELLDRRYVWLTIVWKVISEMEIDGDYYISSDYSHGMPEMAVVIMDMLTRHGIECWTEWSGIKNVDLKYCTPVFGQDGDIVLLYCVGGLPRGIGSELRRECLLLNTVNWKGHKINVALRGLHLRRGKPDAIFGPVAHGRGLDMNVSYTWLQMAYIPLRICES